MSGRYFQPKKVVLLTGAGFSKPFGGYLGSEMWSVFFNRLRSPEFERMRNILREEMNYERAYAQVIAGKYSQNEKDYFTKCLIESYDDLDGSLTNHMNNNINNSGTLVQALRTFISLFAGEASERGFVFTLNQDLLVERYHSNHASLLQIPLVNHHEWFRGNLHGVCPKSGMPPEQRLNKFKTEFWTKQLGLSSFCYVKLHGSYGWESSNNKNAMVIGVDKAGSIAKEPLLSWYLDLFHQVLNQGERILVVVGYGFKYPHINLLISEASKTGLKMHVISPLQPEVFKNNLVPCIPNGETLWEMLDGYYCGSVEQMFAGNRTALGDAFLKNVGLD